MSRLFLVMARSVLSIYFGSIAASGTVMIQDLSFEDYINSFQRVYRSGSSEYSLRRSLFQQRAKQISAQNQRHGALWQAGFNEFTDRSEHELALLRGWRGVGMVRQHKASRWIGFLEMKEELPSDVSWGHLKALKDTEDQGGCGSCWAFAAANMLSAHYEIHANLSKKFSKQQLVNCVPNPKKCGGTGGCQGATVELALGYVQDLGELDHLGTSDDVPYLAVDADCSKSSLVEKSADAEQTPAAASSKVRMLSWETLPSNEALPLLRALTEGPVAVSAAASSWFSYEAGIFDGCKRDDVIDHAILAAGYGLSSDGVKYWIIQNSWGPRWGESGFIRLFRHGTAKEEQEFCGIDNKPKDGVECEPYPDKVTICGMCGVLYDSVSTKFGVKDANTFKVSLSSILR